MRSCFVERLADANAGEHASTSGHKLSVNDFGAAMKYRTHGVSRWQIGDDVACARRMWVVVRCKYYGKCASIADHEMIRSKRAIGACKQQFNNVGVE